MEEREKTAEAAEETAPEAAEVQERGQETSAKRPAARRAAVAAACAVAAVAAIAWGALALAPRPEAAQLASASSPAAAASGQQREAAASQKPEPAPISEEAEAGAVVDEIQKEPPSETRAEARIASGDQYAPQGGSNSSEPSDPARQWIWIVDQPATTQTVHHDVVMTQEPGPSYTKCTVCGADITGFEAQHAEQHVLAGVLNTSWTTADYPPVDVVLEPAWDEVIEIPERGHWEYK